MSHHAQTSTPQQVELLRWTASLGAITAEALACHLDTSVSSARARLTKVKHRNLLACERPLAGRPALFTLTRAGLRECGVRGIEPCRISPSNANHLIVCAAAAVALERSYPDHRLIGERELRRDEREHGGPLASALLGASHFGHSRLHRPDLVLWPRAPHGLPVAVEVELTVKAPMRLLEICRAWARCRVVAGVIYLAPQAVERALSRTVAKARAAGQIAIVPLTALPDSAVEIGGARTSETRAGASGRTTNSAR